MVFRLLVFLLNSNNVFSGGEVKPDRQNLKFAPNFKPNSKKFEACPSGLRVVKHEGKAIFMAVSVCLSL